jgi:hypothetical protein
VADKKIARGVEKVVEIEQRGGALVVAPVLATVDPALP